MVELGHEFYNSVLQALDATTSSGPCLRLTHAQGHDEEMQQAMASLLEVNQWSGGEGGGGGSESDQCRAWHLLRLEGTDFGQSRFGHPDLTNFGPIQFWPKHFWIWCVSWPQRVGPKPRKMGPEGWSPEVKTTFIKTIFIKKKFHQKTLSSKNQFHQKTTFIKSQFHQKSH